MTRLLILRGVSGSGKSTWAAGQNGLVVSRDAIRAAFFPHFDDQEYYQSPAFKDMEESVTRIQDAAIAAGLKAGTDVIVDNTNVEWKFVKALAKIGWAAGADVEVKVFDVGLRTAQGRNVFRGMAGGRLVPGEVLEKQYERFQKTKNLKLPEVAPPKPYNGTPGKPKALLVDVDGTLMHMGDRRGPFEWHNVHLDEPDEVIVDLVRYLANPDRSPYTVIVMSGRDEAAREGTIKSLDGLFYYNHLFMRPEGDMRPDNIVKAELFDQYVRDNYDVQFVLDDRQQVVDMWRRMGLTCLQVAPGDF